MKKRSRNKKIDRNKEKVYVLSEAEFIDIMSMIDNMEKKINQLADLIIKQSNLNNYFLPSPDLPHYWPNQDNKTIDSSDHSMFKTEMNSYPFKEKDCKNQFYS